MVDNYYELQICNIFVRCGQVNGRAQIKLQYSAEIIVKSSDVIQKSVARRFKYLEVYVACGYIYIVQNEQRIFHFPFPQMFFSWLQPQDVIQNIYTTHSLASKRFGNEHLQQFGKLISHL